MNKQTLYILASGIGGLLVGVAIGLCLQPELMDSSFVQDEPEDQQEEKDDQSTEELVNDEFPLQLDSSGPQVERLQIFLMRKLGWVRKPTGNFDKVTLSRVKKWLGKEEVSEHDFEQYQMNKMVHDQRFRKT